MKLRIFGVIALGLACTSANAADSRVTGSRNAVMYIRGGKLLVQRQ